MNCDPHWTAYISALTVPTIALFGVLIALLQWNTNRNKLKLDLFERRYEVYAEVTKFLSSIMSSGAVNDLQLQEFLRGTRQAKWLFSDELAEFLDKEIYHLAVDLQMYQSQMEGLPVGEERSKNVHAAADIKKNLLKMYSPVDEKFGKYLSLKH
ncbi:hypothetical protein [Halomonas litopenaei]|uniref:hypothetical protein n=1 Tax=Halomonas litopenaei TaxID=2109328 RepID=UPI001A8FD0D7|nr:hypothetical protein [Halomonas litopenaei]MBN8413597.1 hypothetical protein [Halomonas litopenaei]